MWNAKVSMIVTSSMIAMAAIARGGFGSSPANEQA
jgi:hypothetical protein